MTILQHKNAVGKIKPALDWFDSKLTSAREWVGEWVGKPENGNTKSPN